LTLPEVVQYLPGVRDAGKAGREWMTELKALP